MKEPKYPYKSGNYINYEEFVEHELLRKIYAHPDCAEGVEEQLADELIDDDPKRPVDIDTGLPLDMPAINEWWYNENILTLDELMTLKPEGVDPKHVIVQINRNREIRYIEVRVYYQTKNSQSEEEWQAEAYAEDAEWKERIAQYKEELFEYRKWQLEEKQKALREDIENEVH